MRNLSLFALAGLLLQGGEPAPIVVPIQNPSFEDHLTSTSDGFYHCGQIYYNIPGWHFSAGGTTQISTPKTCDIATPPDGSSVAFAGWGTTISQDVGPALPGDGVYTLKFYVADYFYWYMGTYKASLFLGTYEICSTSGYAMGDFTQITMICPDQRLGAGRLKIVFAGTDGFPVVFDNVSLTFRPGD